MKPILKVKRNPKSAFQLVVRLMQQILHLLYEERMNPKTNSTVKIFYFIIVAKFLAINQRFVNHLVAILLVNYYLKRP